MSEKLHSNNHLDTLLKSIQSNTLLDHISITSLKTPITIGFYEQWLNDGSFGGMVYLKDHLPTKKNPKSLSKNLKSVISVAQPYYPAANPTLVKVPARVALYAHNNDYHYWLKDQLLGIVEELKNHYPNDEFLPFVDSGPILERDHAYQNRIGWFGKNTCLINPKTGSLFFIAEILTTIEIPDKEIEQQWQPIPDFCGTCTACIDICPTNALLPDRYLKADQCISYLTIESKNSPPLELRKKIGDWFFGCDLCQTICPWNKKIFKVENRNHEKLTSTHLKLNMSPEDRAELVNYFTFLLTSSNRQITKYHYGSPLLRAGPKGLKKNAMIVIANSGLKELLPLITDYKKPDLVELASWTLEQLVNQKT